MTIWTRRFMRTALAGGFVIATAYGLANAQTIVEMSTLKCGDYLRIAS